ncbi:amidohydrolase family protein [Frankia sp. Cj3]|uniref:amidohydrolase family protein n=1 Tax=Frankia sp. Cj3 TaxID=2880976 RepID=UPI001EF659CD|nr:amidohydrolase family protein [Frankia sp. Cj3]
MSEHPPGAHSDGARPSGYIDVHHHMLPPTLKRLAVDRNLLPPVGGPPFATWDLGVALETMDMTGIELGLASAAIPSEFLGGDAPWAAEIARTANESLAEIAHQHPQRFGFLAYVPLPFMEISLAEIAYAFDELDADGVVMGCHADGAYLGDPALDEVFAELNLRQAVVLIHPFNLPSCSVSPFPAFIADFMLDTTRAAIQLITCGTLDRYPEISFILPHAGGFLPYQAARLTLAAAFGHGLDASTVQAALNRFHYDTAGPMSPYATPTLLASVSATRILYGSDYNAVPAAGVSVASQGLKNDPSLDTEAFRLISRENALRLFPAVARRVAPENFPRTG